MAPAQQGAAPTATGLKPNQVLLVAKVDGREVARTTLQFAGASPDVKQEAVPGFPGAVLVCKIAWNPSADMISHATARNTDKTMARKQYTTNQVTGPEMIYTKQGGAIIPDASMSEYREETRDRHNSIPRSSASARALMSSSISLGPMANSMQLFSEPILRSPGTLILAGAE